MDMNQNSVISNYSRPQANWTSSSTFKTRNQTMTRDNNECDKRCPGSLANKLAQNLKFLDIKSDNAKTGTSAGMYGGHANNLYKEDNDTASEPQKSLSEKWFTNLAYLSLKPLDAESQRELPRKRSKLSGKYEENLKYLSTADDNERMKLKRRFRDQKVTRFDRFSDKLSGKDCTKSDQGSISSPIDGSNIITKHSPIIRRPDQNSQSFDKPKHPSETQRVIYHELPNANKSIFYSKEFILHDPRPKSGNARNFQMNSKTELFNIQQNLTFQNERHSPNSNTANKVTWPIATQENEIVNKTIKDISRHPLLAVGVQNIHRDVKEDSNTWVNSDENDNRENTMSTTVSTATKEALKFKLLQTKQNDITTYSEPNVSRAIASQERVRSSDRKLHRLVNDSMKKQKNGFGRSSIRKSSSFVEMKKRKRRISLAAKQIALSSKKSKQTGCLGRKGVCFPEKVVGGKTTPCGTVKHDTTWLIDHEVIDLTDASCEEEPKPIIDLEAVQGSVATTSHDEDKYLNDEPNKLIAGESNTDQDFIVYELDDLEKLENCFEPYQYMVNSQDTERTGTFQIQTCEKLKELEHVLTKVDSGIQLTDAEHAVLVASETASAYLKESITVSGDRLYDFPLTLEQMVEESLWIMTHALLRSFGASSTVYSRLLAISQKASVDASVILKGFLDLLCIELCGENGQSLPDILESVHEIARQLKCREIMSH